MLKAFSYTKLIFLPSTDYHLLLTILIAKCPREVQGNASG